jgi:uncharacterized protein with HEPN domain
MKPETAKRLRDARKYALELQDFIEGRTNQGFLQDRGLQLIVHKLLEIVGEALNGARKSEPELAAQVQDLHRYISLRNQITHGYDTVDYNILWNVSQREIPALLRSLDRLLLDAPEPDPSK